MLRSAVVLLIAAVCSSPLLVYGQSDLLAPIDALVKPLEGSPTYAYQPSPSTMVANRAKVLGERLSAEGTRFYQVTSKDLIGKTPAEVQQKLAPEITAASKVRKVEVDVDLRKPLTVETTSGRPVEIGTTVVHGPVKNLEVFTNIRTSGVTVIGK